MSLECGRPGVSVLCSMFLLWFAAGNSLAQNHADAEGGGEAEEYHENVLGVFVGAAFEGRRDDGLALGIEYEHRFSPRFGIGGIVEHTFGDLDAWVFAVPFAFHEGPWKLYAAPGIEDGEHGSETLFRIGIEYGLHHGDWEISPQLDIDFVDGEEIYVIGVTFGHGI